MQPWSEGPTLWHFLKILEASCPCNKDDFPKSRGPELWQHIHCTFFSWEIPADSPLLWNQTTFTGKGKVLIDTRLQISYSSIFQKSWAFQRDWMIMPCGVTMQKPPWPTKYPQTGQKGISPGSRFPFLCSLWWEGRPAAATQTPACTWGRAGGGQESNLGGVGLVLSNLWKGLYQVVACVHSIFLPWSRTGIP